MVIEVDIIAGMLDRDFGVATNEENLVAYAVSEECRAYIHPPFLEQKTWLFTRNSEDVREVIIGVFLTDQFLQHVPPSSLIVTHHHFDYYEDVRGLQPLSPDTLETLRDRSVSIYVLHAALDTHPVYGTSKALADYCGVSETERFYDYFGAPTALIGTVRKQSLNDFSLSVMKALHRPDLSIHKHRPDVERVAVIAGGGDLPEILQHAHNRECDTILTGTVVNRWGFPENANQQFLDLNEEYKLNLIGATHYGTERPAMVELVEYFTSKGTNSRFVEDDVLANLPDTQ